MRKRFYPLLAALLACALGYFSWQFWPKKAPHAAPIAGDPSPQSAAGEPATTASIAPTLVPISALVSASGPAIDEEGTWRQLASLSVSDKPNALSLALAADANSSPKGVIAEARRALVITLLVDLGRMSEARARTRKFMAEYPASRYLPLVQGVTGIHPRPSPSQMRDAVER